MCDAITKYMHEHYTSNVAGELRYSETIYNVHTPSCMQTILNDSVDSCRPLQQELGTPIRDKMLVTNISATEGLHCLLRVHDTLYPLLCVHMM